jgi:chromosome partitioning protein
MFIIIGNQKGGAGKSTLTMLLANYLTMIKEFKVTVLDMDYQRSIFTLYERAKILENPELYEVIEAEAEYFPTVFEILKKQTDRIILIDLPGKLDDNSLVPVYQGADLILIPFVYDAMTYDSTIVFSLVMRKINPDVKFVYVPTRIKTNVKYETKQDVDKEFETFGAVTEAITEKIDFQRVNTQHTPLSLYPIITPVFEDIINNYINPMLKGEKTNG